jgi:C4-dicarboxylate-specific signal transduction histidine kinase
LTAVPAEERVLALQIFLLVVGVPLLVLSAVIEARQEAEAERRRAELEAQRSREELAHTLRLTTMGELATSLAHELNQPLTAILANAEAARRMLSGPAPSAPEVREILGEIVADDKRAGEIIQRLRELLRKGKTEQTNLELNNLVRDMTRLVGNDVMIRGASLREELAPEPLTIHGDRVQVRQVILNLLVNALEALDGEGERLVVIQTERLRTHMAGVSVSDTGRGLAGAVADVFEPFYTTKEHGMGLGLSIAKSIVEAHGGRISASDNPGRGATFTLELPLVDGESRRST